MPPSAAAQTIQSSVVPPRPSRRMTLKGVYVPAMMRKMFEWSRRFRRFSAAGDQVPRW
jgi:hypothetical protein